MTILATVFLGVWVLKQLYNYEVECKIMKAKHE